MRSRALAFLPALALALLPACAGAPPAPCADPALRLHGHNDYLQPVPLRSALELGLGSIEADVFLEDGELRVGHDRWMLRPGRTLRSMYLEPLRAAVAAHGGRSLRADGAPLVLLVDIKADGEAVYRALRRELAEYAPMLTRFAPGRVEPGAVTVLLSGDRPRRTVAAESERLSALDGRLADLDATPPPPVDLVPWISDRWSKVSDWTGSDELLPDEPLRVAALVAKAHAQGRALRFWGAPDRVEGWRFLFEAGVDHIGTDQPARAAAALRERTDHRHRDASHRNRRISSGPTPRAMLRAP
ncbi:MAG: phosphatidylinositol-specific phospholipase C/glycerophosphodiester phosphodiesterase family protein [Planctomycetota bacterium]